MLPQELKTLFSMTIVCDLDLNILEISDPLKKHLPDLLPGMRLNQEFNFARPTTISSIEDIKTNANSLFLLIEKREQFALRGQMLCTQYADDERVIFVGSPWLIWLNNHRPDLHLGLQDFAAADAQMDQVFYISTERQMVADLENLNRELMQAKIEVEVAHKEKNIFYTQMSHEMRTPLNGVVSALALLDEQALSKDASDLLKMANRSSSNLLKVINYVLDIARLETGQLEDEALTFELKKLLHSAIEIVRPQIIDSDVSLQLVIHKDVNKHYLGLKDRLHQTVLNLVGNAAKFTKQGHILVEATPATKDTYAIRVEVTDTGIGIETESLQNIYKPFYTQAQNTDQAGTGLGLDIVKRNVELMGGIMGVESRIKKGSKFWFEIPLDLVEPPVIEASPTVNNALPSNKLSGTVLLVDDNETNRMLCTMLLEGLGVKVHTENSAESALLAVENDKPDLVFMDIGLPGLDGHEASKILREKYSNESLPIVALTAYTSHQEHEKSIAAGMNDYLVKPVDKRRFYECLAKWLPAQKSEKGIHADSQPNLDTLEILESQIGLVNMKKVVGRFCEEAIFDIKKVENATTYLDQAKAAHALVSTCDSFALPEMASQFRKLEQDIRNTQRIDKEKASQIGLKLKDGLKALQSYIDAK